MPGVVLVNPADFAHVEQIESRRGHPWSCRTDSAISITFRRWDESRGLKD
jgi:hypothetical protein